MRQCNKVQNNNRQHNHNTTMPQKKRKKSLESLCTVAYKTQSHGGTTASKIDS
jgi:hypothetical protein